MLQRISNIVFIVSCVVLTATAVYRSLPAQTPREDWQSDLAQDFDLDPAIDPSIGDGVKAVVVEFSDFECPFCGRYARETYPKLRADFVASGRVVYIFRQLPLANLHPNAVGAAVASECARDQDRFWPMHDRLFAMQSTLQRPRLIEYAQDLGLDSAAFERCLGDGKRERIAIHRSEAARLGITSTPSFAIGVVRNARTIRLLKRVKGAQSYEAIRAVVTSVARK